MTHASTRGTGSAWLVPLADLSLILFIITAATLAARPEQAHEQAHEQAGIAPPQPVGNFAQGVPASVHVDLPGGPTLAEWLDSYHPGSGEQLTVEGYFVPTQRAAISTRAEELAQQALAAGFQPRVILQPAAQSQVQALFAADGNFATGQHTGQQVAQSLRGSGQQ